MGHWFKNAPSFIERYTHVQFLFIQTNWTDKNDLCDFILYTWINIYIYDIIL